MTSGKAANCLGYARSLLINKREMHIGSDIDNAFYIAIKMLEQQPCEDAISRSEAIRVASGYCHWTNIPDELAKLPSVNPKHCPVEGVEMMDDLISRQAAIDAFEKRAHIDWERLKILHPLLEEIEQLPSVSAEKTGRWIPVSERLPEDHKDVLIYLSSDQIRIGCYNSHRLPFRDKPIGWGVDAQISVHNFCSDDVVAWMPLPQPYKAESEDV